MNDLWFIAVFMLVLIGLAYPLGVHIKKALEGDRTWLSPIIGPVDRFLFRVCRVNPEHSMNAKEYTLSMVWLTIGGAIFLYVLLMIQGWLPGNPGAAPNMKWDLAFNTVASFITNTNWQSYAGESQVSYLGQALGLTVQNFISPAIGIAVLFALFRGLIRKSAGTLGNFWADTIRSITQVLLPLSIVFALLLVGLGVVQTFGAPVHAQILDRSVLDAKGAPIEQVIARGPVASQEAIKMLGTNGGGFFNANSAHPLENPGPFSNFLELLAILLIPAALCFSFGAMVRDQRHGWMLIGLMSVILVLCLFPVWHLERTAYPPDLASQLIAPDASGVGANWEGKELRFGQVGSSLWVVATTAASNGSVNAMHDSLTPLAGLFPILLMDLGENVFGGVGSGLYGMLAYVLLTVFLAGLMVGRSPEYLGRKIEPREMKLTMAAILIAPLGVLFGTVAALLWPGIGAQLGNSGVHGYSEVLYALSSAGNNNGSAFGGLTADKTFLNILLGVVMLIARFGAMIPMILIGASMSVKPIHPESVGTLRTNTLIFASFLGAVLLLVAALTFVPALVVGPVAEHLSALSTIGGHQ